VEFVLKESYDQKKKRMGMMAVQIKLKIKNS